jgi:hypothetical protein
LLIVGWNRSIFESPIVAFHRTVFGEILPQPGIRDHFENRFLQIIQTGKENRKVINISRVCQGTPTNDECRSVNTKAMPAVLEFPKYFPLSAE